MKIMGTLVHEMVHAIVGIKEGHAGQFKVVCLNLGMTPKMTSSTIQEHTPAWKIAEDIVKELGDYPHAAMILALKPKKPSPWQRWRSVKHPKYVLVINTNMVVKYGIPRDPEGRQMKPVNPERLFDYKLGDEVNRALEEILKNRKDDAIQLDVNTNVLQEMRRAK